MTQEKRYLSREALLQGAKRKVEIMLEGFETPILMRPLTQAEVVAIMNDESKNDLAKSAEIIALSFVEPKLTAEEVQSLEVPIFAKLSEKVVEISGLQVKPFRIEGLSA